MALIWKQTLAPGVYSTQSGPFVCTEADLDRYAATGNAMVKAGLQIPVCLEHQDGAVPMSANEWEAMRKANTVKYNRGFIDGFRIRHGCLEALCNVPDPETFRRLPTEIKFVSPEINRRIDGTGKDWGRCITHVALTPIPIWHNQKPFDLADVVPSDGASLMAPVGKPLTLTVSPAQLSALPLDTPIRLSLGQTVVQKNGAWHATRLAWEATQSRTGKVKAIDRTTGKKLYGKPAENALARQSKPADAPKTAPKAPAGLREGKIGKGLKVTTPKVAQKVPAKPRAKPKAVGKTESKSAPIGFTPEQEKAFEDKAKLRDLPVTKGEAGTEKGSYSRKLGKLDVPQFAALAKRIDPDTDLVLNGKAFASTRGAYTKWRKQFPDPAEFASKIEAAWQDDESQVAKGKKRDSRGASYAARALAFRHMLQWADEDYAKGKNRPEAASTEEGSAREYKASLEKPHAERVQEITTSVDKKGERVPDPEKKQKFFDQLGTALLRHESPYLKIPAEVHTKLARIINTGSTSKEDRETLRAMTKAALENYKKHGDDAYPVAKVKGILENLSNTGAGTLNPDELRSLLRRQAKGDQLSHGANMADEPETTETEETDDLFGGDGGGDDDANDTEKEGVADKIAKVVAELDKLGVKVAADTTDPEDFLAHLVTALQTHHATKGADGGDADGGASIDDTPAIEEQPQMGVAMSALQKRVEATEAKLADAEFKNLKVEIANLRHSGRITPVQAKAWVEALGAKRLSLTNDSDSDIGKILAKIEQAKENPRGTFWTSEQKVRLSGAKEEEAPGYVDDGSAKTPEIDERAVSRMSGGRYVPKANGKK